MLTTLRIKNLALVEDLTLNFENGFNVITGETGAGKSIIIGALNLLLGERADRSLIRTGCSHCTIEAILVLQDPDGEIDEFLLENGIEPREGENLILKRSISTSSSNRQFINGSPTSLASLQYIGSRLVDIHGPHDHQSLLHSEVQLAILDRFAGIDSLLLQFSERLQESRNLARKKSDLMVDEQSTARELEMLRFQVEEIQQANLSFDEEKQFKLEFQTAANASRLLEISGMVQAQLSTAEACILDQCGEINRMLQELAQLDPKTESMLEAQSQAISILQDLSTELTQYANGVSINPIRLEELEQRNELLFSLKRKYGQSMAKVIEFGQQAKLKLESLENREEEIEQINGRLTAMDEDLWTLGKKISRKRKQIIPKLSKSVAAELIPLGFPKGSFEITLKTDSIKDTKEVPFPFPFRHHGLDRVEFMFSPNAGEPAKPLRAIASSGEMARVMLAQKTVLAEVDRIPILVFDEVDANIGGDTARAVGEKIQRVASSHQVLCITHSASVAAKATTHYFVAKTTEKGRTQTTIKALDGMARIDEISRMLGGKSKAARSHAEELLKD